MSESEQKQANKVNKATLESPGDVFLPFCRIFWQYCLTFPALAFPSWTSHFTECTEMKQGSGALVGFLTVMTEFKFVIICTKKCSHYCNTMLCVLFAALHLYFHMYCERDWVYSSMPQFSVDPCWNSPCPAAVCQGSSHTDTLQAFEALSKLVQGTSDWPGHKQRGTPMQLSAFFSSMDVRYSTWL